MHLFGNHYKLSTFALRCLGITTLFALIWTTPVLAAAESASPKESPIEQQESSEEGQKDNARNTTTEPADGAKLTRPARSLRVWFDSAPIVAKSSLSLVGPKGELSVTGLHSMGENDLMARVVGTMPDGDYTASWSMEDSAGNKDDGNWSFTIQRGDSHN